MPKMTRLSFTPARVSKSLKQNGDKTTFHWDADCLGLGLRITSGSRSFVFQRKLRGEVIRMTLGAVPTDSTEAVEEELVKVRGKARELAAAIDEGKDPRVIRKKIEAREAVLVKDVWKEFLKANKDRWSDRHYEDNERHSRAPKDKDLSTAGILWPLLQMRLVDVDAKALVSWHAGAVENFNAKVAAAERAKREAKEALKLWEADTTKRKNAAKPKTKLSNIGRSNAALRQGFICFRAFWNWVWQTDEYEGIAPPSIFKHPGLKGATKQTARTDVLRKEDLGAWFEAVRGISNPAISAYLQILLLLGCRRNELTRLTWDAVDYEKGELWLHDKVEQDIGRVVPITPHVRRLLKSIPKATEDEIKMKPAVKGYVFYSPKAKSGHLEEPRIPHARALKAAGVEHVSLHGLRRSFSTLSEWMVGIPVGITAQVQGHKASATIEKHYRARPVSLLAEWMKKYEAWILEQAGIPVEDEGEEQGNRLRAVSNAE